MQKISDIFTAEKILDKKIENGKVKYLVKWLSYPVKDSTWEKEENILDHTLIDDFLKNTK